MSKADKEVNIMPFEAAPGPDGEDLGPGLFLEALESMGAALAQAYDNADPLPRGYQRVIWELLKKAGQTQTELANALHIHKVSIGLYLNDLEQMGLVERRPHPTDGRAKCIYVTDYLLSFRPEGQRVFAEIHEYAVEGIPEDEYRIFIKAMTKISANLQKLNAEPGKVRPITPPEPDSHRGDKAADAPPLRKKTP